MIWSYSLSTFEYIAIALFAALYLLFLYRMLRIRKIMGGSRSVLVFKFILRTIYFGLLIVALLGPAFGETSREVKSIGKDLFICVDLSQSMNAFDIQPTRLERVKFELKNIVEAFSSDRIG